MKYFLIPILSCLCWGAASQHINVYITPENYLNNRPDTIPSSSVFLLDNGKVFVDGTSISDPKLRKKLKKNYVFIVVHDTLYVNLSTNRVNKRNSEYTPVERFGDWILYRTHTGTQWAQLGTSILMFGPVGAGVSGATKGRYVYYWNLRSGEFRQLDSGCMYALLDAYPDLLGLYLAESEPNDRKTLENYLNMYLERRIPERAEPAQHAQTFREKNPKPDGN